MSVSPTYLAAYGISAVGGPLAGKYLADDPCPWRTLRVYREGELVGASHVNGGAEEDKTGRDNLGEQDGRLVYRWTPA